MEDDLITFETARLAKEKNFDIPCNRAWSDKDNQNSEYEHFYFFNNDEKVKDHYRFPLYSAPTQSLLKKWLRKIHKIHIIVNPTVTDNWTFALCNIGNENIELNGEVIYDSTDYNSYEEALEKGLIKALKLLKK